ncbi:MAG: type IV pilus modification protein PilV [Gammaproteobacteria bacterium]|nr:type IV pilus modification protein PilV [Gammaproteobacteria bacterium]
MRSSNKGFSLLEVLITLILVTFGILGMMAMQGRAIQFTADSLHRTQAAILTNELIEAVRANPTAFTTNENSPIYFNGTLPDAEEDCLETDSLETFMGCWINKAQTTLPGAADADVSSLFYVCRTNTPGRNSCGNGSVLEIQVAWRAAGENCLNDSNNVQPICTYRVRTQI